MKNKHVEHKSNACTQYYCRAWKNPKIPEKPFQREWGKMKIGERNETVGM